MARPVKLYNHAVAPNPRRVRIFAAEKGIELSLEDVDILAGQSRTPEFLAKNSSGGVPVLEFDTVHTSPSRSPFAGIWRGFIPSRTFWGAIFANRRRSRGGTGVWSWNCSLPSGARSDLPRPFQAIAGLRRSSACTRLSAPRTDGSRAERTPVRRAGPLHNRRHHGVGGNRYRRPFGRHKNSSEARVFDPQARASIEPSKRQGVRCLAAEGTQPGSPRSRPCSPLPRSPSALGAALSCHQSDGHRASSNLRA